MLPPTTVWEYADINYWIEFTPVYSTVFKGNQEKIKVPIVLAIDESVTSRMVNEPVKWNGKQYDSILYTHDEDPVKY